MSAYQPYDSPSEDGFGPAEDPPVIARMPDLDENLYAEEFGHEASEAELSARRLSMPKMVLAASVAVVVIVGGWMILGSGSGDDQSAQESWQPPPPAASAPEAPRWDGDADSKTDAITLDEVLPRRPLGIALPTAFEETPVEKPAADKTVEQAVKVVAKPPATNILPRVAVNRSVAIGTPVPSVTSYPNMQDWPSMSKAEYYWAVRQRSGGAINARNVRQGAGRVDNSHSAAAAQNGLAVQEESPASRPIYRTTSRPLNGYRDSDVAARQTETNVPNNATSPQSSGTARLNGVIEPPNRMY